MTDTGDLKEQAAKALVFHGDEALKGAVQALIENAVKPYARKVVGGYADVIAADVCINNGIIGISFRPRDCAVVVQNTPGSVAKAAEACRQGTAEMFHSLGIPVHQGETLEISREKLVELHWHALDTGKEYGQSVEQRAATLATEIKPYQPAVKAAGAAKSI